MLVIGALFTLLHVAWMAWEAARRLTAGPIRFHLPLASPADDSKPGLPVTATGFGFAFIAIMLVGGLRGWRTLDTLSFAAFCSICALLVASSAFRGITGRRINTRRNACPGRVRVSGWLALATSAIALAFAARALLVSPYPASHPAGPLLSIAVIAALMGAASLREYRIGTVIRDGGVEVLGSFLPWSRIVVEAWRPRDGEVDLVLFVRSPRRLGVQVMPEGELIVPVPAADGPALKAFLAGHTAAVA